MNYWSDGPCAHFVQFRDFSRCSCVSDPPKPLGITGRMGHVPILSNFANFHDFRVPRSRKTFTLALGKYVFRPEGAPRDHPERAPVAKHTKHQRSGQHFWHKILQTFGAQPQNHQYSPRFNCFENTISMHDARKRTPKPSNFNWFFTVSENGFYENAILRSAHVSPWSAAPFLDPNPHFTRPTPISPQ